MGIANCDTDQRRRLTKLLIDIQTNLLSSDTTKHYQKPIGMLLKNHIAIFELRT